MNDDTSSRQEHSKPAELARCNEHGLVRLTTEQNATQTIEALLEEGYGEGA